MTPEKIIEAIRSEIERLKEGTRQLKEMAKELQEQSDRDCNDLEVRKQIEELANDWHHKGFASDEDCPLCMQDLMDILWHFYKLGKVATEKEIYTNLHKQMEKVKEIRDANIDYGIKIEIPQEQPVTECNDLEDIGVGYGENGRNVELIVGGKCWDDLKKAMEE